jgi:hypothetical protein
MNCQLCDRLGSEPKAREREWVMAQKCMDTVNKTGDLDEFEKSRVKLSDARLEQKLARLILEKHRQDGRACAE